MNGMDGIDRIDGKYVVDGMYGWDGWMDGIGGTAVMSSYGNEAPARAGMSRLEYPPHINIDAAEALA
jgi:hypothetical protein